MPISCKEMILSNDYADFLVDFELTEELLDPDTAGQDYCYRQVDRFLGLVFTRRESSAEAGLLNDSYQRIPSLFGLQAVETQETGTIFDPTPLISSGILSVQASPLELTGKGTILAFLDTGERVQQLKK